MRKMLSLIFAAALAVSLTACSGNGAAQTTAAETKQEAAAGAGEESKEETEAEEAGAEETAAEETEAEKPETVAITALNAGGEAVSMEVPFDPQRVAILDLAVLDIMDNLGVGDRVVGSAQNTLDYLQSYVTDENVAKLGTIKEADMEAVMACEPDIIFIGGRLSKSYDALSEIAPVVYISTDMEKGVVESVSDNAMTIASIFGLEDLVEEKMAGFDERIEKLSAAAEGKTALVGMCTSGSFNLLGNDGRCSIIGREIGFENLTTGAETSTHGNETSFELVASQNPDYIFVMDRDAAIGTDGAQLAKEIMENELVMGTDAYKNGRIVYLEHPAAWYTAEGGITALDYMLEDLEEILE